MSHHPSTEKTLVLVKPDGVQRSLVGEILSRYERVGLKLVAVKMVIATAEFIETHYTLDSEWRRLTGEKNIRAYEANGMKHPINDPIKIANMILQKLKNYMTSGPVVAVVLEGANAVAIVRKITGGTEPLTSDVGTIRGDFVLDSYKMSDDDVRAVRNLVHASGSVAEANKEISHWFTDDELYKYTHSLEKILYDVNIDDRRD